MFASHPLLALRALVHEREEVQVCGVRLCLPCLDQAPDVAVDPGSGTALGHVGRHRGPVPQLLGRCAERPPLEGRRVGS